VTPDEYVLRLRTGERVEVSEFDHERLPDLMGALPALEASGLIRGCTVLTRKVIEAAKRGDDAELCKALRDPKAGLLKVLEPECSQRRGCAMFDRDVCTARNLSRRKLIPPCYESGPPGPAGLLAAAVVLAGSAGRRPVIVVPDPPAPPRAPA
jgi:hypothetical protein